MNRVALGLRAHSGWAALVAVEGPRQSPRVVERARVELVDTSIPRPFQPYHAAAEMRFEKAEEFIRRALAQTRRAARQSLEQALDRLRAAELQPDACAILLGSGRPLGGLKEVLAAHPLIHTAEGELFRQALAHAARRLGLAVAGIKERELRARAESELGLPPQELQRRLVEWGRALGPPWQQDQKFASLAAWLAL